MVTSAPDSTVLLCTATVGASDGAGIIDNVTITDSPDVTGVVRFLVPQGQTWILEDLYISASGDSGTSDPVVRIYKDGGRIMGTTPPLSNLLVTNNSRPPYSNRKFLYRGGQTIQMQTLSTIANDTDADSIKFTVRIRVVNT